METIRLANVDRTGLHDLFQQLLPAPYGRNLDALHDSLSCLSTTLTIELDEASLLATLGDRYYDSLLRMLRDTAEENSKLTISVL
ncbi:MAG: barstar family protein [Oscillospiraceae bacterium]|nr:barstar family protein [Oscillospiraceae bacterium]